jgi:hypothetical protein
LSEKTPTDILYSLSYIGKLKNSMGFPWKIYLSGKRSLVEFEMRFSYVKKEFLKSE